MPAMCNKRVGNGTVTFGCNVTIPDGAAAHLGPCSARENARSVREREEWQQAQATLAATQGPAQTFHESMGEGPGAGTGVPGSGLTPSEHREQHQPKVGEEGEVYREPLPHPTAVEDPEKPPEEPTEEQRPPRGRVSDSLSQHVGTSPTFAPTERAGEPAAPTKTRPEDQRLPVEGFGPIAHKAVQDDLEKRLQIGISRYGKGLQAGNGRNSFQDGYEEVLDQAVYFKTLLIEREHFATLIRDVLSGGEEVDLRDVLAQVGVWLEQ